MYSLLRSFGASLFLRTTTQSLCLHLAATSGSHPICELICEDMAREEALRRLKLTSQHIGEGSILESTDQDGEWALTIDQAEQSLTLLTHSISVCLSVCAVLVGMTGIDMALSSGYKSLASRLAQWSYVDTRTMVLPSLTSSHFICYRDSWASSQQLQPQLP
jgi:hypothetical protein